MMFGDGVDATIGNSFDVSVGSHFQHLSSGTDQRHPYALYPCSRKGRSCWTQIGLADDWTVIRSIVKPDALEKDLLRLVPIGALSSCLTELSETFSYEEISVDLTISRRK